MQLLVLYFRFSRATSGALSRALLSVFSCNFWCPFSCSTFGFLVQLLVPFLVLYFRFSRATSGALLSFFSCNFSCSFSFYFFCSSFFFMCYLALPLLITYSPDSNSPLRRPCFCQFARATSGAISRAPLHFALT